MTRIILVRHGQTEWNKVERIRGQVDIALNKTGLAQAEATSARLAEKWTPVAVYSSPLTRAMQTAEGIARRFGYAVQVAPGFIDINFGQWQGLSPQQVHERWPEMARAWLTMPHTVTFPEGENLQQVQERSMSALHNLIELHPKQDVVVVAHTVVNRVVLCAVLGLDNSHHWNIGQEPCALNVFRCHDGTFFVDSLNDTCHLEE